MPRKSTGTYPEISAYVCENRGIMNGTGAVLVTPLLPLTTRPESAGARAVPEFNPSSPRWRPVVGFEGLYKVSDHGAVVRVAPGHGTRPGRPLKWHEGWAGYPVVSLSKDGQSFKAFVHRLVALAFLGPCPPGHEVNHRDGNKRNPLLPNLEYVTRGENIRHAAAMGLANPCRGEAKPGAKLTEEDVRTILRSDASDSALARRFGVSAHTVLMIRRRKKWSHVNANG